MSQADGMISFRGGTQDASVLIVAKSETETEVTVNSKAGHAGLSWGLGIDSKKLQRKVLEGISKGTDRTKGQPARRPSRRHRAARHPHP